MSASAGVSSTAPKVFLLAFRPKSSDGVPWNDDQCNNTERLDPSKSKEARMKEDDYKLKIGALCKAEILHNDPQARGRTYMLKDLPTHYHIRRKKRATNKSEKDTKHAYDYYIYGHPTSDRKGNPRHYASPNEFFPHVLWLISGSTDRGDCSCKLCNKTIKPEPEALKRKIEAASVLQLPDGKGLINSTGPVLMPQVSSMRRTPSASGTNNAPASKTAIQPRPATAPVVSAAPGGPTTAPIQPAASAAPVPAINIQPEEATIFREGEIVWFKQGSAWRIGLVLETESVDAASGLSPKCCVKPLAHAAVKLEDALKSQTDMRPFLAFSVPPVNLKEIQDRRLHQIDWHQLLAQNPEDRTKEYIALEASKKAVIEIDKSFSTFNAIPKASNSTMEVVGGLFLGAERIAVNEAVRVRLDTNEANPAWAKGLPIVMVLRNICLTANRLHFLGDVYRLEETASQPSAAPPPNNLPYAMLREQAFRNEIKKSVGTRFEWVLVQQNQDKGEDKIRGRFYESSKLMPILDAARFQAAVGRGEVEDVQAYLNNHLDSAGEYMGRRKNRLETLSTSVPAGSYLNLGPGIVEG